MFRARKVVDHPVTIYLDGDPVVAARGEPIAAALLAADKTIIARSPKLHRPRAPSCFRGACDGCLARVDGVPNVMTCLRPATGGEKIESQNVVGSRRADLLRVTDWFFKKGIDHHHLMAGVPGLSDVMQTFARKLAGLGRLPGSALPVKPAEHVESDVVVIGGGVAGIAAASEVAKHGASVLLVDDAIAIGGSLAASPQRLAELLRDHDLDRVAVRSGWTAAGHYEGETLIASGAGAARVRARAVVFATGAHDGVAAFAGNDMPGVFSARAFARLLALGLVVDGRVVIAGGGNGSGFWADELESALGKDCSRIAANDLLEADGTAEVRAAVVRDGDGKKTIKAAVIALDMPGAPSFELAAQAGAKTKCDPAIGYAVAVDHDGRVDLEPGRTSAPSLWAVGECTGVAFDPSAIAKRAAQVGRAVAASLR